ncbi:MAG: carboxypeptidase-like regulatory domain-containing protein [Chloroflexota bacterium]|nr:carboxypeptidase-like regulatory domain-containing protein [Chloroflexota bacterium]
MTKVETHKTSTSMVKADSDEIDGDADMALKVKVSCHSACDLWGKIVKIVAQDSAMAKESVLVSFDGTANETDEFIVRSPFEPGEYTWTAVFPAQEKEGVLHEESSTPFSFIVNPHAISIKVWDVPSSIAIGDEFRIKIGVKCSSECSLTSQKIEIYDHEGAKVATGTLGQVSWSDDPALFGAEVELGTPSTEGRYRWTVKFPEPDLEVLHKEASCTIAFGIVRRAEHVVTIEVIDKDKAPVNARVRLRPRLYRGSAYTSHTDDGGVVRLNVPKGDYELYVWGNEYERFLPTVKVASDVTIKAELLQPLGSWRSLR